MTIPTDANANADADAGADSADLRWAAVQGRDPAFDGRFVYSVRTTGVYCRPSCPSRAARRANVAFHADPNAAEAAGFRPCLRCAPHLPPLAERQRDAVARVCRLIDAADEAPDLDSLAQAAGMSRFHFHRVFKAQTGITPKAYAAARRGERVGAGWRRARRCSMRCSTPAMAPARVSMPAHRRCWAWRRRTTGPAGAARRSASPSGSAHWARSWWRRPRAGSARS